MSTHIYREPKRVGNLGRNIVPPFYRQDKRESSAELERELERRAEIAWVRGDHAEPDDHYEDRRAA